MTMERATFLLLALNMFSPLAASESKAPVEADYYPITTLPVPPEIVLEVGAIELVPGDRLAVGTRRGDIYLVDGAMGDDPSAVSYVKFAEGLHEVLGLAWRDGWLYATIRQEVVRIRDEDGDDRGDVFESVSDGWGLSGDYHEYAFGARFDREGNLWVALCLTGSFTSEAPYRGWALRITPDGRTIPSSSGIRSPGGVGFDCEGEVFYTENQGPWNGSSSLKHLRPGSFQGHPGGNRWYDQAGEAMGPRPTEPNSGSRIAVERARIPEYIPTAVILPHARLGQSPTGIACDDTDGKFGPFRNQLFIGDQTYSNVTRVYLEKVNGVYQGAAIPFVEGFQSGLIGVRLTAEGQLFVGGSDRGWGARGGKPFNFERIDWTGRIPFELLAMRATAEGFEIEFTEPADAAMAADPASYRMEAFTYIFQSDYGSPEVDQKEPVISAAAVSEDGKTVRLRVEPLTVGHVHGLHLDGIRSPDGRPLLHPEAWYTLNEIPFVEDSKVR